MTTLDCSHAQPSVAALVQGHLTGVSQNRFCLAFDVTQVQTMRSGQLTKKDGHEEVGCIPAAFLQVFPALQVLLSCFGASLLSTVAISNCLSDMNYNV